MKIKDQAMGFGVEGLFDPNKGIDIIYINPGEEYVETIIWDGKEKNFHVGCLIDYLEREGEN
jgi:hypothetical protein